ncbi:MAG: hypothetical protein ACK4FM_01270 [Caldimicrobium sp.]
MILGTILGLVGSVIPEVIKFIKERQDHKYEKEMFELQMKYQREMTEARIQEARALAILEADKEAYHYAPVEVKPTGRVWIDVIQVIGAFYNQTVRPTLTYLVVGCWLLIKYASWQIAGGNLQSLLSVWTDVDNEFVAAVVMFWFGGRAFSRTFQRLK